MRLAPVVFLLVLVSAVGDVAAVQCPDGDRDDYVVCDGNCTLAPGDQCGDCDDSRVSVRPGAPEACTNGRDDDCDGATDGQDSQCSSPQCIDHDKDGYAVCNGSCVPASGDQCGDCDDERSSVRPGASEACTNGRDDDCDGATDGQDSQCPPQPCVDHDNDGYAVCNGTCVPASGDQCGDCDDDRSSVRPGASEACTNGRDDDCDGATDGEDSQCPSPHCPDQDGDGWALCSASCAPSAGDSCGDCNDARADVNPNRAEACNGRDDDCDGSTDEGNPGGGAHCNTGQPGICADGTRTCTGGQMQCSRDRGPRSEDCDNGLDDDCNGLIDEHDAACAADCTGNRTADSDGDHVPDCVDNCPNIGNHNQNDFDEDGSGDACESGASLADINRSGRVDGLDLAVLGRSFAQSCNDAAYDRAADLSRDCRVDGEDLAILGSLFGR